MALATSATASRYASSTLVGNWWEDRFSGPVGGGTSKALDVVDLAAKAVDVNHGGTTLQYTIATERQHRDAEATGLRLPPFGAHLLISKQTPPIVHGDLSGTLAGSKLGAKSEQAGTLRTASATAGVSSARAGTCALGKSRNISASQITFNSIDDRFDYTNVINPDRKYPAYTWCSVTESEHFAGAGEKGEFRGTYKLASNGMTSAESTRAAYRARWTNDTEPAIRDARFTTEAVRTLSTSAPEALRPCAQRFLPGTCKALETLREKAQAALGLNAVWMVARMLPTRFNLAQLKRGLETLGVTLSVDEGKDVWKQWDAEATGTTTRDIAMTSLLTHTVSTLRVEAVDTLWLVLTRICHADKVPVTAVVGYFDARLHRDVKSRIVTAADAARQLREAFAFIAAGEPAAPPIIIAQRDTAAALEAMSPATPAVHTLADDALIDAATFRRYFEFVSAACDKDGEFVSNLVACWHMQEAHGLLACGKDAPASVQPYLVPASLSAPAVSHVLLMVTHRDGRRSMQRIAQDSFLRLDNKADVLTRLAAAGVLDAVDFSLDF